MIHRKRIEIKRETCYKGWGVKVSCDGEIGRRAQFAQNVIMISTTGVRNGKDKGYKKG